MRRRNDCDYNNNIVIVIVVVWARSSASIVVATTRRLSRSRFPTPLIAVVTVGRVFRRPSVVAVVVVAIRRRYRGSSWDPRRPSRLDSGGSREGDSGNRAVSAPQRRGRAPPPGPTTLAERAKCETVQQVFPFSLLTISRVRL